MKENELRFLLPCKVIIKLCRLMVDATRYTLLDKDEVVQIFTAQAILKLCSCYINVDAKSLIIEEDMAGTYVPKPYC